MTKKHFIELADVIKRESSQNARFSDVQIETLATFCQNVNPRFNRSRWIGYIKGENGKNGGAIKQTKEPVYA